MNLETVIKRKLQFIKIIKIYYDNLHNKNRFKNTNHCGAEGHSIEKSFGISPNSKNESDINGYELKKKADKITFGDWSPSFFTFDIDNDFIKDKDTFFKVFGNFNIDKQRYSWSGRCIPKYGKWNYNGTIMRFNKKNDLRIIYCYNKDTRKNKDNLIPNKYKNKKLLVAYWTCNKLKQHVERKFNNNGFIIINDNKTKYIGLSIGKNINFKLFCDLLKNCSIIFDPGMYQGNSRKYCHFRASKKIWNHLIIKQFH